MPAGDRGRCRGGRPPAAAGAVILGKTVTTELAFVHPGKTATRTTRRDPGRLFQRLRGGRRGRHGAARAWHPDQRLGDPARIVLRRGRLQADARCDPAHRRVDAIAESGHVGVFAHDIEAAALADALRGYDQTDPMSRVPPPRSPGRCRRALWLIRPRGADPDLAFCDHAVSRPARRGCARRVRRVARCSRPDASNTPRARQTCRCADLARSLTAEMARIRGLFRWRRGQQATEPRACRAGTQNDGDHLCGGAGARWPPPAFFAVFARFDALVAPAATGEAPQGLAPTGDPVFCTFWSFCGLPAVSLPLLVGAGGLPVGVQ